MGFQLSVGALLVEIARGFIPQQCFLRKYSFFMVVIQGWKQLGDIMAA